MRKLIADMILSLDGYYTSPESSIDWFEFDDDEWAWSRDILRDAGAMLYGRVTYEEFRQFWPTAAETTTTVDRTLIERLNELPKLIFSRTLEEAPWQPATLVREEPSQAVARLKREPGKDLVVVGSGTLVGSLLRANLIDEIFLRIRPIILGAGRPLFVDPEARHPLSLLEATTFDSGVLGLHYELAAPPERHP